MKRSYLLLIFTGLLHWCSAQQPGPVARAEYDFARHAADHGARAAFLRYMDSSSVIFDRGVVQNGIRYWQRAPGGKGLLLWEPVFACTAGDGRSGFTTGPFEFRKSPGDTVRYCGQYTTVWLKNAAGDWHFWADLGITYATSLFHTAPLQEYTGHRPAPSAPGTPVTAIESAFITAFRSSPQQALAAACTADTWLNNNGRHPLRGHAGVSDLLERLPAGITFTPLATVAASSRDLVYTYGLVHHGGTQENYLRIWAYTPGGWKLLLQVMKW